jgi:hypothetical protein
VTYKNGTTTITDFAGNVEDNLTSETSIIDDNGEVLLVKVSKEDYLANATHFNIDAYTWKESGGHTYIDYLSEIPGHPGETGNVIENEVGSNNIVGMPWYLFLIIIGCIIAIILVIVLKVTGKI